MYVIGDALFVSAHPLRELRRHRLVMRLSIGLIAFCVIATIVIFWY